MRNPAAKAVRSPKFKPKRIERDMPYENTGCNICGDCSAPEMPRLHYVHGHLACEWCGINVDPCCQGEIG